MAGFAERFWAKVVRSDGCWEWSGARGRPSAYGLVQMNRKLKKAHRVAYELAVGPIPPGFFVCHRCDNPPCCRPDHLFVGDASANQRDSFAKGRSKAREQHPRRSFKVIGPDGRVIESTNLRAFCASRGLDRAALTRVLAGAQWHHHGYRVTPVGAVDRMGRDLSRRRGPKRRA